MTNEFEKHLARFRSEVLNGRAEDVRRLLASGDMANPAKIRAAQFALDEDERERQAGTFVFPVPPDTSFWDRVKEKAGATWKDPVWSKVIADMIIRLLVWGGGVFLFIWSFINRGAIIEWFETL